MTREIQLDGDDLRFAAMAVVAVAHNGQTYHGDIAFAEHLLDVAGVAAEFGLDSYYFVTAALLHDIVEDTDVTVEQLRGLFPTEVVDMVEAVTDETGPNGEHLEREERTRLTRAKTARNRLAVALKLCDRTANTRATLEQFEDDPEAARRYVALYHNEYPSFYADLHYDGEYPQLWAELNRLHGELGLALVK